MLTRLEFLKRAALSAVAVLLAFIPWRREPTRNVYTSVRNGRWDDPATWGGKAPGTIGPDDTVVIRHTVECPGGIGFVGHGGHLVVEKELRV